jgi:hypothetical protein
MHRNFWKKFSFGLLGNGFKRSPNPLRQRSFSGRTQQPQTHNFLGDIESSMFFIRPFTIHQADQSAFAIKWKLKTLDKKIPHPRMLIKVISVG